MRLKINLHPKANNYSLPINYQYYLSSAIYRIIENSSESFALWLHENGYKNEKGRMFKFFCFSNLLFDSYKVNNNFINVRGDSGFFFSSPMKNDIVENFIKGIFKQQQLFLGRDSNGMQFSISNVEICEPIIFGQQAVFRLTTPVSVSTVIELNDTPTIYYHRINENGFLPAIANNLKNKYKILYEQEYIEELDIEIVSMPSKPSKLITIKEGQKEETKIKGFLCDLKIRATPEMLYTAYHCGLGERNSTGFGFVEIKK